MRSHVQELREAWVQPVDLGYFDDDALVRCSYVDLELTGTPSLLLQIGGAMLAVDGDRLVKQGRRIVVPAPAREPGQVTYYAAEESHVSRVVAGQTVWQHEAARRRVGIGCGRNDSDDLEWGRQFLGSYREQTSVVGLTLLDFDQDGREELLVLSSSGHLELLTEAGEVAWRKQLPHGCIQDASVYPLRGRGRGSFIVSTNYRQLRKHFYGYELRESLVFLFLGGRLRDTRRDFVVHCPLSEGASIFLDARHRRLGVAAQVLTCSDDSSSAFGDDGTCLLCDPWSPARNLLVVSDTARQRLVVKTPDSEELWEHRLPPTESSNYPLCGVLGPAGSPREEMLAVWFATTRTLADVRAEVTEEHLRVLRMDGTLIASRDFPPSGERRHRKPILVLCKAAQGPESRLLVVDMDAAHAYGFMTETDLVVQEDSVAEVFARMPEYPLPEAELWSVDWLGETSAPKAPAPGGAA